MTANQRNERMPNDTTGQDESGGRDDYARRYARWYDRITRPFRGRPGAVRLLNVLDKGLVYLIAAVYIAFVISFALQSDARSVPLVVVPAVEFALCTVIRAGVNAPRPYERCRIQPLILKNTQGKSFPSRHISSAAIIACALWWISPAVGAAAFIATAVVCFCRIVGGVHFPRDVVGALVLAFACAAVGFLVIA